jgi:protein-L-isoaspartate O-methyltransferase
VVVAVVGVVVAPVGVGDQELVVVDKSVTGTITTKPVIPVRFVPMKKRER